MAYFQLEIRQLLSKQMLSPTFWLWWRHILKTIVNVLINYQVGKVIVTIFPFRCVRLWLSLSHWTPSKLFWKREMAAVNFISLLHLFVKSLVILAIGLALISEGWSVWFIRVSPHILFFMSSVKSRHVALNCILSLLPTKYDVKGSSVLQANYANASISKDFVHAQNLSGQKPLLGG